jgi:transposase
MSVFPTAKHLATLGRHHAGNNSSAGKVKSSKTRPSNPHLQGALGTAAMWAAQNPHTFIGARYRRIASRRGPQRANVAVQHTLLTAIWHMGTTGTLYEDLGGDYYSRLNPERARTPAIRQLEAIGYRVSLDHAS